MRNIFGALFAFGLLLAGSGANAGLVSVNTDPDGHGTITLTNCPVGGGGTACALTKEYGPGGLGSMFLSILADTNGLYTLTETIINNTGTDWTDFHWELSEEFGEVVITAVSNLGPFTTLMIDPTPGQGGAWLDDGTLLSGQQFITTLTLQFNGGSALPGGLISIDQYPTFDVPEPGTFALLGLGLVGLGFARRRRAA